MKIEWRDIVFFGWVSVGLIVLIVIMTDSTNLSIEALQRDVAALMSVVILAAFSFIGMIYSHEIYLGERKKKGLHKWTREDMDNLEKRIEALEEKSR